MLFPDDIQNTSRGPSGNVLTIRHITKPPLLCTRRNEWAKQGRLPYTPDCQHIVKRTPARDLYVIRQKHHRNNRGIQDNTTKETD